MDRHSFGLNFRRLLPLFRAVWLRSATHTGSRAQPLREWTAHPTEWPYPRQRHAWMTEPRRDVSGIRSSPSLSLQLGRRVPHPYPASPQDHDNVVQPRRRHPRYARSAGRIRRAARPGPVSTRQPTADRCAPGPGVFEPSREPLCLGTEAPTQAPQDLEADAGEGLKQGRGVATPFGGETRVHVAGDKVLRRPQLLSHQYTDTFED